MIKIIDPTIFIIDDDDLICETLSDIFQEKGYDIAIARNGREAINKAEQTAFDIAFIDIKLPDICGIDLLKEFKKLYPDRICIIITGYATLENAVGAIKDGADGYFLKPLILEELLQRTQNILEKRRLQQELKESEKRYREAYNRANLYKDLFAHDINNILQCIQSSIDLLPFYLKDPKLRAQLEDLPNTIKEQVKRGANLVSNVKSNLKIPLIQKNNKVFDIEEEFCLVFNKEQAKILVNTLNLLKDVNNLSEENVVINELINKIYDSIQGLIDEGLIDQKEIFKNTYIYKIYNDLISLFDKAEEAITVSVNENIKYANPAFIRMLGYKSENEIIKLGLFNIISKRYLTKIKNYYDMRLKGEIVPNIHDLELKRADGSAMLIECIHYCMPFKDFNLIIFFYIDLKKIKSLEKKLRESEERYRVLFENSPIGIGISNVKGNALAMNKAIRELTGFTLEELNEIGLEAIYVDPSDRGRLLKILEESGKVRDYEVKLKRKVGTEYIALFNIDIIELRGEKVLLTTMRDFSEHKKAEMKLRESEGKMRLFLENSPDFITIVGRDATIQFVNRTFPEFAMEEVIGRSLYDFTMPENYNKYRKTFAQVFQTGRVNNLITKAIGPSGDIAWYEIHVVPIKQEKQVVNIMLISTDITERKKAEQKIRESEEKYRFLFDTAPIGIGVATLDGKPLALNNTMQKLMGYSFEEMKEVGVPALFADPNERNNLIGLLQKSGKVRDYEIKFKRKDGTKFIGMINADLVDIRGEKAIHIMVRDITKRKKAEKN